MTQNNIRNQFHKSKVPNVITFIRIILIFPIILFLENNFTNIVWFLIIFGGITDYLDGYIAKKLNSKTTLGAIIDPLADKAFILILFAWLCINKIIPYWSLSLIIFRELIISSLRISKSNGMPAIKIAKYKSFFQFLALIFLFYPFENQLFLNIGLIFYWFGFILCIFSLFKYLSIK